VILLVEDNPDDMELTRLALAENNLANRVVIAEDGASAVSYFFDRSPAEEAEEQPVLILLDLKLPKVSGLEVLRRVRTDPRTRMLPVVILTTSNEEPDLVACYSLGCNSYVRKPVDFTQFVEAVRELGLYWLVINEPPPVAH
jgi:two-component system response regulator